MDAYLPSNNKSLSVALDHLGVPARPASLYFRDWLRNTYPDWPDFDLFCESLPLQWFLVEKEGYSLCYLASESIIIETASRSNVSGLLPIGTLMSGAFLVIDTNQKSQTMAIGRVKQHQAMADECAELDRCHYHDFNLSYPEWLYHVTDSPTDLRYL